MGPRRGEGPRSLREDDARGEGGRADGVRLPRIRRGTLGRVYESREQERDRRADARPERVGDAAAPGIQARAFATRDSAYHTRGHHARMGYDASPAARDGVQLGRCGRREGRGGCRARIRRDRHQPHVFAAGGGVGRSALGPHRRYARRGSVSFRTHGRGARARRPGTLRGRPFGRTTTSSRASSTSSAIRRSRAERTTATRTSPAASFSRRTSRRTGPRSTQARLRL